MALVENSSRAPTNDSGEKLLGNKRAWLPDLMTRGCMPMLPLAARGGHALSMLIEQLPSGTGMSRVSGLAGMR